MNRLALAAIIAVSSLAGLFAAAAEDFALPAPGELLRQIRSLPRSESARPTPVVPSRHIRPGYHLPDERRTPGKLCTADDASFQEYRYDEQIPYCRRNVTEAEKRRVAAAYGVAWERRREYEFDHRVPLCMGGSNDDENIWPQPLDEAHEKDKLEDSLCRLLRGGTIRQKKAVAQMLAWPERASLTPPV